MTDLSTEEQEDRGLPLFWGVWLLVLVVVVAIWLFRDGGGDDAATLPQAATIHEVLETDGRFTTLLSRADELDVAGRLSSEGPFTLFAPTDGALADVSAVDEQFLLDHLANGRLTSATLAGRSEVFALGGSALPVEANDDSLRVGDADVVEADIEASNGLVHVVDGPVVELPSTG